MRTTHANAGRPRAVCTALRHGRAILAALADVLALHRLSDELALILAARPGGSRLRGRAARATLHVPTR